MNYRTPQEVDWFPIWNILLKQVCIEIDFATKQICWITLGSRQLLAEAVVKNKVVAWMIPWLFYLWLHLTKRLLLQSVNCTQDTLLRLQPVCNQKIKTWHFNWNNCPTCSLKQAQIHISYMGPFPQDGNWPWVMWLFQKVWMVAVTKCEEQRQFFQLNMGNLFY